MEENIFWRGADLSDLDVLLTLYIFFLDNDNKPRTKDFLMYSKKILAQVARRTRFIITALLVNKTLLYFARTESSLSKRDFSKSTWNNNIPHAICHLPSLSETHETEFCLFNSSDIPVVFPPNVVIN